MTNQKAIALLEEIRPKKCKMVDGRLQGGFSDHDSDTGKAIDLAIESLEKQIPKKPIEKDEGWIRWFCPTCNSQVGAVMERKYHFCDECGQAIDWSEGGSDD